MTDTPGPDAASEQSRSTAERLQTLSEQWHYFKELFDDAVAERHEMRKTNLRGNLILIEREIRRLGGTVPESGIPADSTSWPAASKCFQLT